MVPSYFGFCHFPCSSLFSAYFSYSKLIVAQWLKRGSNHGTQRTKRGRVCYVCMHTCMSERRKEGKFCE